MSESFVPSLFPLVIFDRIPNDLGNAALSAWGHFLGPCRRPFTVQAFGLHMAGELLAVACSASTINSRCGGYNRTQVIELARLCTHPHHRDLTRVALRLWRKVAPAAWSDWPAIALVSYANTKQGHTGDVYRFDGWKKVADVKGGSTGPNAGWTRAKKYDPKSIWVWHLTGGTDEQQ